MIFTVIGMILAFLVGAYVREPFVILKKEERIAPEEANREERDKLPKQFENLMTYTGRTQEDDE